MSFLGKKIMIIGNCGSGKSTLSRILGKKTGLPVFHLDQYYWKADWQETPKAEWEQKVKALADQDAWIIDGNYGGTMDIRLAKADSIIFLRFSTILSLYRVCKRIYKYNGQVRPDMPSGCKERWNWNFLHYVLVYNITRQPGLLKKLKQVPKGKNIYIFKKPKALNKWVKARL